MADFLTSQILLQILLPTLVVLLKWVDLVAETIRGRKAEWFSLSADYELNLAGTAGELRAFNADVRSMFPKDAILAHGSHQPNEDAPVLSNLADDWKEFAREN